MVTKLDRLARSLPDARAIADELTARQISLSLGWTVYHPTDAVGRLLFNVLCRDPRVFQPARSRLRRVECVRRFDLLRLVVLTLRVLFGPPVSLGAGGTRCGRR